MTDSLAAAQRSVFSWRSARLLVPLVISVLVVGIAWSLASPVGSSPDDNFHVPSIWCSGSPGPTRCERVGDGPNAGTEMVRVPRPMADEVIDCFKFRPDESAACTRAESDSASAIARANDGAYPSGFYAAMSLLVGSDVERSVALMRLAAWTWSCLLIGASVLAADRTARPALVTALLVSSVPMLVFILASTNPSGWTVAGSVACFFALTAGLRAPNRSRSWVASAIAAVAAVTALVARPDGGLWVGVAAATAILVNFGRVREITPRIAVPAVIGGLSGLYLLWFTSSTSLTQTGLSLGQQGRPFRDVVFNNLSQVPSLWTGSLGTSALGWFDTPVPALVPSVMVGVWASAGALGLTRPGRSNIWALLFLLLCAIAIPLYLLAADGSVVGEGVQPRYLLPLLPMFVAAALIRRVDSAPVTFSRPQLAVMGSALVLAHAVALHANMRRWITGRDVLAFDLGHGAEWWWDGAPAPMLVWIAGSIAGAAVVAILGSPLWTMSDTRRDDDPTPVAGPPMMTVDGHTEVDAPRPSLTSASAP